MLSLVVCSFLPFLFFINFFFLSAIWWWCKVHLTVIHRALERLHMRTERIRVNDLFSTWNYLQSKKAHPIFKYRFTATIWHTLLNQHASRKIDEPSHIFSWGQYEKHEHLGYIRWQSEKALSFWCFIVRRVAKAWCHYYTIQ